MGPLVGRGRGWVGPFVGRGRGHLCGEGAVIWAVAIEHPPHHRAASGPRDEVRVLVALGGVGAGASDMRAARVGAVDDALRTTPAECVGRPLDKYLAHLVRAAGLGRG